MMKRGFETVTCPGCGRRISAYVPRGGDGSDVRIVTHSMFGRATRGHARTIDCPAGGRLECEYKAAQQLWQKAAPPAPEPRP